jgi:hypothetical protein
VIDLKDLQDHSSERPWDARQIKGLALSSGASEQTRVTRRARGAALLPPLHESYAMDLEPRPLDHRPPLGVR